MATQLEDQGGNPIRLGKAGVQRALMDPVSVTASGKKSFAMVFCQEKDVYISRDGADQRSCTFNVTWWAADETDATKDFVFADRDKAISLFLRLVKTLYE